MPDLTLPGVLLTGTHAARPAATAVGGGTIYACSTHAILYQSDGASWGTWWDPASSGVIAGDAIWDAAGDLAVGTGANTAARLAIGAAGGAVSRVNGAVAWNSGTSFPTAATGDRYWRTDVRGGMEFTYDGSRWLSERLTWNAWIDNITATGTQIARFPTPSDLAVYLDWWDVQTLVNTTNDGTKYWTAELYKTTAANALTQIAQVSTISETVGNWVRQGGSLGLVLATTDLVVGSSVTKVSTPGSLYINAGIIYRLIGT